MSREVQAAVVLVIGVVLARLALSDAYLAYVKSSLQIPLLLSAAALLGIGALTLLRDREDELAPAAPGEPDHTADGHGHGHDHSRAPRVGILMLIPILALVLIAPEPLGAYAANRGGANRVAAPVIDLGPLPEPVDGVVPLTLGDTVVRALYDPDGALQGTAVQLIGFVSRDHETAGYRLSRFAVACCAADASVRQVLITGTADLPDDAWVEVVAVFDGDIHDPDGDGGAAGIPIMRGLEQRETDRPASPYEF